jgi:hypothetical protein
MTGAMISFDRMENNGGLIYLFGSIPNEGTEKFRLSYFDDELIVLVYRTKKHIYNLVFQI